jgi:hypothetical protein
VDQTRSPEIEGLVALLDELDKKDWVMLSGSQHAQAHKLTAEVEEFRKAIELVREVTSAATHLIDVPKGARSNFKQIRQGLSDAVGQLEAYAQSEPAGVEAARGPAINKMVTMVNQIPGVLAPYLALARTAGLAQKFTALTDLEGMKNSLAEREREIIALREQLSEALTDAKQVNDESRKLLAKTSVSQQGRSFQEATDKFRTSGFVWVGISVLLAGTLILHVRHWIESGSKPPLPNEAWTVAGNLGYFAARAMIVSVISFMLVVAVRNFRSARHNEIMNAHRSRALQTFEEFRQASKGSTVQDAILLHAAEAIFSVQASGFAPGEPLGATHVGEIIKIAKEDSGRPQ